jgi:acyl dehydratase
MTVSLAELHKGDEFPPVSFELSTDWVSQYVDAVDDCAILGLGEAAVPPMAVAALSIRAMLEHASLPPGTVHAGQELSFRRAARVGEVLEVSGRVVSRGERAGWVLMSVEMNVSAGSDGLMDGRATVSFPAQSEAAA